MFWPFLVAFGAYLLVFRAAGEAWARRWKRYTAQPASCGHSGEEVAHLLLEDAKVDDIHVARGKSNDTSRFDPHGKRILLGPGVFDGRSVAAVTVAAQATIEAMPAVRDNTAGSWRRWVVTFGRGGAGIVVLAFVFFAVFRPILFRGLLYVWLGCALVLLAGHLLTLGWEYQISAEAAKRMRRLGWIRRNEEEAFEEMRKAVPLRDVHGIGTAFGRALASFIPGKGRK